MDSTVDLKVPADVLSLGVRCFGNAIALGPKLHQLWYDLAVCYNSLADASQDKISARLSAVQAVKKSLQLKNTSWNAWNLLGILSMTAGEF